MSLDHSTVKESVPIFEYRDGLALPLFTRLDREWELDAFKPFRYHTSIFYMKKCAKYDIEKPYFFNVPVEDSWKPTVQQTNVSYTRKTVAVTDIRGYEDAFSLDRHGFQLGILRTSLCYEEFSSDNSIVTRYYQDVKEFLTKQLGATEVLPFDFQVGSETRRMASLLKEKEGREFVHHSPNTLSTDILTC